MSSYSGKTVAGSDGSDHSFREKVASQYKTSASLKSTIKTLFLLSFLPMLVVLIHIMQEDLEIRFLNVDLPQVEVWQYVYMLAPFITFIGYSSLHKNKATQMSIYIYFSLATLVPALLYKAWLNFTNPSQTTLFKMPLSVLNYIFVVLTILMHAYSLFCASKLVKAWKQKGYKSK
uniref:Protein jagunal homolog 1 n=2 Tax=Ciona intestinalis TaxID=7719 RepID=F6ZL23_CIOIN|nr:protein jagunal homolog 1-A isoform X2 [Ciona intestinalis]|eukprot:XP_002127629.1 protein jagunal homolog 1-A isoform X2 [Ciona intestinalis]